MKSARDIIVRPLITEKGTWMGEEDNKYLFEVSPAANKIEIRAAVEKLWDVTVLSVRTQNVRGKNVIRGKYLGRKKNWKKAVVKLAEGDAIEMFEGV
ncbi:MAG: 50S ribosomal protein L23 [Deltaproteobacteria bacterium]|nr:50S ribosomal protein L23 [Deltaproteobacteria bacterium]